MRNECYLVQLLAHLVGLSHHGHQFDIVVEDGQQAGVSQTGPGTGLTYTHTHTSIVSFPIYLLYLISPLLLTQVDAFSSGQLRLEVVVVVATPVVPAPLRGITNEQVGTV